MSELTRHETDVHEAEARDKEDGIMREFLAWIPAAIVMTVVLFGLLYGFWLIDVAAQG